MVTCRNCSDMSVATTSSTGAPPSATTTPLFRGSVDERSSGPPPRNGMIRSCGSTSRECDVGCIPRAKIVLVKHHRERAEVALRSSRPMASDTAATRPSSWRGRPGRRRPVTGGGREGPAARSPCHLSAMDFPDQRQPDPPERRLEVVDDQANPLKTTASSRRARTFAARRNRASTLLISGVGHCALRTTP